MDIFHSIFLHVGLDAVDDVDGGRGIYKVGGSDGYAGGSCKDKFQRILSGGDAAHADDRDLYGIGNLVDHTHSDRMHSRSGDTAGLIGQCKGTAVYIDLHTGQRIDQRHRIGSACLCCPGDLSDIRYVRGQLHDYRLLCDLFDLGRELLHMLRILAESEEARVDVGAGNVDLHHIEPFASSACEMVAEILQYFTDDVRLKTVEADCIYAGIIVDTNNFVAKTGVRTFEAAAFLRRSGADVTRVRKLFRDDITSYRARAEAVRRAEIFMHEYAISRCPSENLESPTVVGAQAANELLNIVGIKASFVLTEFQGKIYFSARAIDEVNVQIIMERLGGGGHQNIAGAQLSDVTMSEAINKLKEVLTKMTEEGAI